MTAFPHGKMIRSWTLSSLKESNSSQCFSSGRTAAALHSENSNVQNSSDEDLIDFLQPQVVDKNAEAYGSICDEMRAQETDEKTMYGKQMPLDQRNGSHQQAVRRGYLYQAANGAGYSEQGVSYPRQGNDRITRRPRYSYQLETTSGYSVMEGPQKYPWNEQFRRQENFYQHQNNGRVKHRGYSYQLARIPESSQNEASVGPQQYQWNNALKRPVYSYQANSSCSGCPDHEANTRPHHFPENGRVRRLEFSYQRASGPGYSCQQADQDQAQHKVQDRRMSKQRNETAQPRRGMEWSRHRGARLPPIQQCIRLQQHSQTQSPVAARRYGRQETCQEGSQGPAKRNGVCNETDDTQTQRIFLRVLAKRF